MFAFIRMQWTARFRYLHFIRPDLPPRPPSPSSVFRWYQAADMPLLKEEMQSLVNRYKNLEVRGRSQYLCRLAEFI